MPYIHQKRRDSVDPMIELLRVQLSVMDNDELCGVLNYIISKMTWELCGHNDVGECSYDRMNAILGALDGAKKEFYRRIVAPYEDKKKIFNGDI